MFDTDDTTTTNGAPTVHKATGNKKKFRRKDLWLTPEDDARLDRIIARTSHLLGRPVAGMVCMRRALALLDDELRDLRSSTKRDRELAALFRAVAPR